MKKHILLVDDEAFIRDILYQAMSTRGYRISCAASSLEAHRIVKSDPPDIIVSDLQLEDADGLEMISELKKILPDVPVMLLTGVIFDNEVIWKNINKRVSCYVEKTAPLQKIIQEIQRLLGDLKPD